MVNQQLKKVQFNYLERSFCLRSRTQLKAFIFKLFKTERVEIASVNYIFCSDSFLLKLNKDFLHHDTYTDIITFQYTSSKQPVVSDIYISIDRVRENAKLYHISFKKELYRVLFHGALHLCGYNDKMQKDIQLMRLKEDQYLREYVSRETKKRRRFNI